jgi:uncharacterized membrane protein YidH (DUF202 family)
MSIGASIFLIAAGAILRFAVSIHSRIGSSYINWNIVGDVLMIVGVIGLLMSAIWMVTSTRRIDRGEQPYAR